MAQLLIFQQDANWFMTVANVGNAVQFTGYAEVQQFAHAMTGGAEQLETAIAQWNLFTEQVPNAEQFIIEYCESTSQLLLEGLAVYETVGAEATLLDEIVEAGVELVAALL